MNTPTIQLRPLPALLPVPCAASTSLARCAGCRIEKLISATPEGQPQTGVLIRFEVETFDPSLYQVFDIIRPDSIARSVVKRQAEFFYGRLAARLALAAEGQGHINLPIGLSREPVWPAGWTGSISHTTGLAGAIVARTGFSRCNGIGFDLERIADAGAVSAILRNALDSREAGLLAKIFVDDVRVGITIGFSAKESLYKAAFGEVRAFFGFEAARIAAVHTDLDIVELVTTRSLAERISEGTRWLVRYRRALDGYVVTHTSW